MLSYNTRNTETRDFFRGSNAFTPVGVGPFWNIALPGGEYVRKPDGQVAVYRHKKTAWTVAIRLYNRAHGFKTAK